MPNFGVWEWLIILIIVLVIFGASRLRDLGSGLGGAINAFRSEVKKGKEEDVKTDRVSESIRQQEETSEEA